MSVDTNTSGRMCGCLGCGEDAFGVIEHPRGRRVVCEDHVGDHEVIRHV